MLDPDVRCVLGGTSIGDRPGVRVEATGDGYRRVEELVVTDAECWENTVHRDSECDP